MIAAHQHRHRPKHSVLSVIGVAILVYIIGLALYLRIAHGATGDPTVVAIAPAVTGLTPSEIAGWVGGGVGTLLGIISMVLHWLAPRTKTPWDDRARDAFDAGVAFVRGQRAALVPAPTPPTPAARASAGNLPLLAVLVLGLAGSQLSCTHSTRTETLQAAQLSVGAARDSLATYDQLEQDQIIMAATSLDDGHAKLASWRHKRAELVTAIATAFRAISIAGPLNDQPSLSTALTAAGEVVDAIKAIVTREHP